MELNNIRQLYDYNRWAGHRTLTVARALANDDFLGPMGNSFSSVRDTLAHILGAEWIYLERWQGRSPKALLDPATFPTVQSLESRWETLERDQMQFIEALTPQLLGEELAYINLKGQRYSYPLWQQLVHVVNHSSYHRGQVTTLLRQLGAGAVSTDFLVYFDEKPRRLISA
ncbi:MAG TPA: DinB family protein [Candidatus Acidoferrum sp.]|nr:DinB family protein [Candidatus Acidoferrum sp.]